MLKKIQNGLSSFFTKERVLILIIFFVLIWALYTYSGMKMNVRDGMGDGSSPSASSVSSSAYGPSTPPPPTQQNTPPSGYSSQPTVANPSDLLPVDTNSAWSALNPPSVSNGNAMMPDLLQAGYHIGLDTIGQTLRNANLQLRSDPIIPKQDVGPWMQSTIEPDMMQVPLEINGGGR